MSDNRAIFTETQICQQRFNELADKRHPDSDQTEQGNLGAELICRTLKRFTLWCETLGAHVRGLHSLDERLRDASKVRELVLDCLSGIKDALHEALDDSQDSSPSFNVSLSPKDGDNSVEGEALQRLLSNAMLGSPLSHVDSMLDILFRVTVAIRPALSADRYKKAETLMISPEEDFSTLDDNELARLFPNMSRDLRNRLLAGSLQRRRLLQYTKRYRENFKTDMAKQPQQEDDDALDQFQASHHNTHIYGDSDSLLSRTASTFSVAGILSDEVFVSDSASETSSINSVSWPSQYRVPPFPDENENDLRICIACYLLLPLPDEKVWKGHILKDIRPYICTFPNCTVNPEKIYSSRQAWFEHELTFHRRQWHCPGACSDIFLTFEDFVKHLNGAHGSTDALSSQTVARGREIPRDAETPCPFCAKLIKSRERIKSHIGQHQKQIALMALSSERGIEADSDNDGSENGSKDQLPDMPNFSHQVPETQQSESTETELSIIPERPLYSSTTYTESPHVALLKQESSSSSVGERSESTRYTDNFESSKNKQILSRISYRVLSSIRPRAWILMPDLGLPYHEAGSFRLGQVLCSPLDLRCYLPNEQIPPIEVTAIETMDQAIDNHELSESSFFSKSRSSSTHICVKAKRMSTFIIHPTPSYVQRLIDSLKLNEIGSLQKLLSIQRKFYIIRGLMVAWDCMLERSTESATVAKGGTNVELPGVGSIQLGGEHRKDGTHSVRQEHAGPVIVSYSLTEVKQSWLGNFVMTGYEKGDMVWF